MNKREVGVLVAMTLVGVPLVMAGGPRATRPGARACGGAGPWGGAPCGPGLERVLGQEERLRDLGVTDDQIQRLKDILFAGRKQMIALWAEREQAQLEIQQLFSRDKIDREALNQAAERLGDVVKQIHQQRVQQRADVQEVLGPQVLHKIREQVGPPLRERRLRGPTRGWRGRGMNRPPAPEAPPMMEEMDE